MKPLINNTSFGSITIGNNTLEYDVIIHMNGEVEKRRKKLSKRVYGSSHLVSLDEAKDLYEEGAKHLIVGAGQNFMLSLSGEANEYFEKKRCKVDLLPTPKAINAWNNETEKKTIGLFHVTC